MKKMSNKKRVNKHLIFIRLTPKNSYKVFSFKIAPEDEKTEKIEEWIKVIKEQLQASEGSRKSIPSKDYKLKFWKVYKNSKREWIIVFTTILSRAEGFLWKTSQKRWTLLIFCFSEVCITWQKFNDFLQEAIMIMLQYF